MSDQSIQVLLSSGITIAGVIIGAVLLGMMEMIRAYLGSVSAREAKVSEYLTRYFVEEGTEPALGTAWEIHRALGNRNYSRVAQLAAERRIQSQLTRLDLDLGTSFESQMDLVVSGAKRCSGGDDGPTMSAADRDKHAASVSAVIRQLHWWHTRLVRHPSPSLPRSIARRVAWKCFGPRANANA